MISARRFSRRPASVSAARRYIRDALGDLPSEQLDAAELIVSELSTNSVKHARSDFEIAIERGACEVRVEVRDRGPGRPRLLSPSPTAASGRGLKIVEAMSSSWGVVPSADGKIVWFKLTP